MAITLLEYNQRLNGVIKDLQSGAHGTVMTQVASDAIVLVKQICTYPPIMGTKFDDFYGNFSAHGNTLGSLEKSSKFKFLVNLINLVLIKEKNHKINIDDRRSQ